MAGRVLYIEDDPNHRFTMELLLAGTCQVISVADGEHGIIEAKRIRPDLIIVDIMLHNSELDGYGIIRAIRSNPQLSDIPLIAITGHTGEAEKQRCLEDGCDGFFTKPLEVDTFAGEIKKYI